MDNWTMQESRLISKYLMQKYNRDISAEKINALPRHEWIKYFHEMLIDTGRSSSMYFSLDDVPEHKRVHGAVVNIRRINYVEQCVYLNDEWQSLGKNV